MPYKSKSKPLRRSSRIKTVKSVIFGAGRACINPPMPISLAGYFNIRMWDKVLDDLEVRALVLNSGKNWSAVIQFDLVSVPQEMVNGIYAELARAGIRQLKPENMIITATHSHTAPKVRQLPGEDKQYVPFAIQKAVTAVKSAMADLRTGTLSSGLTSDHRFLFNRRYWMKNGEVITNPGKLNSGIVCPEGEIDPEIPLLAINKSGRIRVLIANIVNHTDTIGGNGVSADWPGFLRRRVEGRLGSGSMVIPLIGAAGNINHFNVRTDMDQTCYAEARRIGEGYATTILKALGDLRQMNDCAMFTRAVRVSTQPRAIPAAEVAAARAALAKYKNLPDAASGGTLTSEDLARKSPVALKYFAFHTVAMAKFKDPIEFLLTGIFMGSACILSLPCEPFVEIGLTLRKEIFADRLAMVGEQCNGTGHVKIFGGYIPNAWNYGRGGYETTPRSNPLSTDTAARLLAAWRGIALSV